MAAQRNRSVTSYSTVQRHYLLKGLKIEQPKAIQEGRKKISVQNVVIIRKAMKNILMILSIVQSVCIVSKADDTS